MENIHFVSTKTSFKAIIFVISNILLIELWLNEQDNVKPSARTTD